MTNINMILLTVGFGCQDFNKKAFHPFKFFSSIPNIFSQIKEFKIKVIIRNLEIY